MAKAPEGARVLGTDTPAYRPVPDAPVSATPAPAPDPRDAEIAALRQMVEAQGDALEQLRDLIQVGAVNAVAVTSEEESRRRHEERKAWISQGPLVLTQEACDKMFVTGQHRFRCVLADGNRHPEIVVRADNEIDAAGRYKAVCGIRSAEKDVTVSRVAA